MKKKERKHHHPLRRRAAGTGAGGCVGGVELGGLPGTSREEHRGKHQASQVLSWCTPSFLEGWRKQGRRREEILAECYMHLPLSDVISASQHQEKDCIVPTLRRKKRRPRWVERPGHRGRKAWRWCLNPAPPGSEPGLFPQTKASIMRVVRPPNTF